MFAPFSVSSSLISSLLAGVPLSRPSRSLPWLQRPSVLMRTRAHPPTNPLFWVLSPHYLTFHCLLNIPQAPKTHSLPQNKIWHHYSPTAQVRMAGQCLGFLPLPHTHFPPVFSHLHSPFCKTEPGVRASQLFSLLPSLYNFVSSSPLSLLQTMIF